MQHVSHFSQLGLVAFDFFGLGLWRFDDRSRLFPVTRTVAAGHSATGRAVRNPVKQSDVKKKKTEHGIFPHFFKQIRCGD